ncbi:MAG: hypothetical protein KDC05_08125, partial [Bacteroidales bacterium]|nr:hypothetical protein [Bacteroidales bacterium]
MAGSFDYNSSSTVYIVKHSIIMVLPVLMLFCPVRIQAQTYNPNILPLGDKESLMANTGTGGLGSVGAVYYNPAALTEVEGNSLSLSGSAYLQFRFSAKPVASFFGTDLNYEGTGYQSIPTSVIYARPVKNWHLAYSILIPMAFNFEGTTTWNIPVENSHLKLKMLQNYDESVFMGGITAARTIGKSWSVGISLYGQSYSYLSTIDLRGSIVENPGMILQTTDRRTLNPVNLLVIGGIHKKLGDLSLGLRLQAPSVYITGKGSYYDYSYNNFGGTTNIETSETEIESVTGYFKTPADIRLGTTYRPTGRWLLAVDAAYRFSLAYDIYNSDELTVRENLKGNYRINAGTEYRWSEKINLYAGASYTPTTKKETDGDFGEDYRSVFTG